MSASIGRLLRESVGSNATGGGHSFKLDRKAGVPKSWRSKTDPSAHHLLYKTQFGVCFYCHRRTPRRLWTVDHRIPTARGGSNNFWNKVGACFRCNNMKSCLTDVEFQSLAPTEPGIEERCRMAMTFVTPKLARKVR